MKLRQACCNPDWSLRTPIFQCQLEVFSAVIEELLGGRHKALSSANLSSSADSAWISGWKGIAINISTVQPTAPNENSRLMNSNPARVTSFSSASRLAAWSEPDAADYVIHMTPGGIQPLRTRHPTAPTHWPDTPVTIYRLICKNTIEEKIVKLHQEKRILPEAYSKEPISAPKWALTIYWFDQRNLIRHQHLRWIQRPERENAVAFYPRSIKIIFLKRYAP